MLAPVTFRVSQDRTSWIMTVIVLLAVTAAVAGLTWAAVTEPQMRMLFLIPAVSVVLLLITVIGFIPLRYRLTDEAVIVDRLLCPVRLPWPRITAVRHIELHHMWRTCGAGGFFGTWGRFTSRELPRFRAYIKRRAPLVCLDLDSDLPVVLSPDDAATFIAAVNARLKRHS